MPRRHLGFESLEPRSMLSGDLSLSHFAASILSNPSAQAEIASSSESDAPTADSMAALDPSSSQVTTDAATRWDWLANTFWCVPTEYILAYTANSDLSDPTPVADQTVWHITQAENGQLTGNVGVNISTIPFPTTTELNGVVTPSGQVRIEFTHTDGTVTTGVGQMRFRDGAWRIEMQMATGSSSLLTHWAYMAQTPPDDVPLPSSTAPPVGSTASDNWSWLADSDWGITDSNLFGAGPASGVFSIDSFNGGYFFGTGMSSQAFNVLGSVTPEGNILLAVSYDDGTAVVRNGYIEQTSIDGGVMRLHSYESSASVGSAWTFATSQRLFMSSVQGYIAS